MTPSIVGTQIEQYARPGRNGIHWVSVEMGHTLLYEEGSVKVAAQSSIEPFKSIPTARRPGLAKALPFWSGKRGEALSVLDKALSWIQIMRMLGV